MAKPEELARQQIDDALRAASWAVQDSRKTNLYESRGVAVREFALRKGHGVADYLLFVDHKAVGVLEAKKAGVALSGVERQTRAYGDNLPSEIPAHCKPLPFLYESNGAETCFTNGLDPTPRSRYIFNVHRPETLATWLDADPLWLPAGSASAETERPSTLRGRLRVMPGLVDDRLWGAQERAVRHLEESLAADRPRALIQMATGSGKTFTAVTSIYRMIKHAKAQRVLFIVDRGNLGEQTEKEFQQYVTPDDGRKFTELYNVQRLTSNKIDPVARVVITTIQRLYSILKDEEELPEPSDEERSLFDAPEDLRREPVPVSYQRKLPPEAFDIVFIDECHRSIYSLWRQVVEYFDAHLVGLTATPSQQTFAFFDKNLVMEYSHEEAVTDGVNVDCKIYRIITSITKHGSTVEAGPYTFLGKRHRLTRVQRWERLDEDFQYGGEAVGKDVIPVDQIRTVLRTYREKLPTEIFPGRSGFVPKTLIFARDDAHADDIVRLCREEFGQGNDFCQKITYRTELAGKTKIRDLIRDFAHSPSPRIAVTVDMIATGTDIKPLEVVMFMRTVRSANFFEQMKGRGVRVINHSDFAAVTPDTQGKTHYVLVDCVGVTEHELAESRPPLDRQPTVALDKLLDLISKGNLSEDVLATTASRLSRLWQRLDEPERDEFSASAVGLTLPQLAGDIVRALDYDLELEEARRLAKLPIDAEPTAKQLQRAAEALRRAAVQPLAQSADLRERLLGLGKEPEQTLDNLSIDKVLHAGFTDADKDKARTLVKSFREYIEEHKDKITALQVLYSRPYKQRLRYEDIKQLAAAIQAPPRQWTPDKLWRAYQALDKDHVKGSSGKLLTNIVQLVRFALEQERELVPFPERVQQNYQNWLAQQRNTGRKFSDEQQRWLDLIAQQFGASASLELDDFEDPPFVQRGGAGRLYQVFGDVLEPLLAELNEVLVA